LLAGAFRKTAKETRDEQLGVLAILNRLRANTAVIPASSKGYWQNCNDLLSSVRAAFPPYQRNPMNDSDVRDTLIALSLLPFLTPNRTRLLREYFGHIELACDAPIDLLQGLLSLTREQAEDVKVPLKRERREIVAAVRASVITLVDGDYPPLLREIIDPPLALHVAGNRDALANLSVAIVGSRRATPYGLNAAQKLARDLAAAGITIVSGLARGIDAAAHEATLDAHGPTIGVLGTGIDVVYPRSHRALFRRVAEGGAIVSELAPGTPPKRENFPIRNRIISGLSKATVIVEATSRSGSLITARMAAEQGRDVCAVPGSIFSDRSEGTHRLIQYGAKLVHDADDVLEELGVDVRVPGKQEEALDGALAGVLSALSREEGSHVDLIAARLKQSSGEVAESLLQLELGGWIRALPGARYVRIR
jgi:DNA processing protein